MKNYGQASCLHCSTEFTKASATQKFCKPCQPIANKIRNTESLKALRLSRGVVPIGSMQTCEQCGAPFVFRHGVQKTCKSCQNIKRKETARTYRANNPDKVKTWAKTAHSNNRMGGSRNVVLKRDKHTCHKCGKHPANVVHHIDCFGEKSGTPNNSIDNLVTLCASCHAGVHAMIDKLTRERHQDTILEAYAMFNHSHWTPHA